VLFETLKMEKVKNAINKLRQGSTSASGVNPSFPSISAPTLQPIPSAGMQNSILSRLVQSPKEIGTDITTILSLNSPQLEMFKQRMQSSTDLVSHVPVEVDQEGKADYLISSHSAQPSSMELQQSITHEKVVPISGLSMMPRYTNRDSRIS
jgi:hypothetical protein